MTTPEELFELACRHAAELGVTSMRCMREVRSPPYIIFVDDCSVELFFKLKEALGDRVLVLVWSPRAWRMSGGIDDDG